MNKQDREAMSVLSKQVFGSRNSWRKILEKGMMDVQTRTITETVPGEDGAPDTTRQVQVAISSSNGKPIKISRYFSETELLSYMTERKDSFDAMMAQFQAQQDALVAKEKSDKAAQAQADLQIRIHEFAAGSGS